MPRAYINRTESSQTVQIKPEAVKGKPKRVRPKKDVTDIQVKEILSKVSEKTSDTLTVKKRKRKKRIQSLGLDNLFGDD